MATAKLPPVNCQFGAPMGRADSSAVARAQRAHAEAMDWRNTCAVKYPDSLAQAETDCRAARKAYAAALHAAQSPKFHLRRVQLDSGGYDSGGAYWGHGAPLYWAETADGAETTYLRAANRTQAKAIVRKQYAAARFFN